MLQRLAKVYTIASVMLVNTLLCVVALNAAFWVYGQVDDDALAVPNPAAEPHSTDRFDAVFLGTLFRDWELVRGGYPELSDFHRLRMGYETSLLTMICDDDLVYRIQPIEGQFVTVDERGFRHIEGQAPFPPPEDVQTVFMFGGSTTFGYMVDNSGSVPSQLQAQLRARLGEPIAVYNFGALGYTSIQERLRLGLLLEAGYVPDVAIFLDGINDLTYYETGVATGDGTPCQPTEPDTLSRLTNLLSCEYDEVCLPIARFATARDVEREADLSNYEAFVQERTGYPFVDAPAAEDDDAWRDTFARWRDNRAAVEALAEQHGFHTLYIIQPTAVTTPDITLEQYPFDAVRDSIWGRAYYAYPFWLEGIAQMPNVLDLSDLAPATNTVSYVTYIHYAPQFAGEIAAEIAEELIAREWVN